MSRVFKITLTVESDDESKSEHGLAEFVQNSSLPDAFDAAGMKILEFDVDDLGIFPDDKPVGRGQWGGVIAATNTSDAADKIFALWLQRSLPD